MRRTTVDSQLKDRIKDYMDNKMSNMQKGDVATIGYGEIASALHVSKVAIREILQKVGGGFNGITLGKD